MSINYAKLKTNDGTYYGQKLDALVDAVKACTLQRGRGYRVRQTPLGINLDINPSQSAKQEYPFDISAVADSGSVDVRIRPGSVNQLLPDNYDEVFSVSASDLVYVKVKALTDGKKVTSCTLIVDSDEPDAQVPTPFTLPEAMEVLLGVLVNGVPFRIIGLGSIQLVGLEEYRKDKSPAAGPGELAYEPFMVWKVEII